MRTILDKKILPLAKPMELISKYRFVLLIAAVGVLLMLMPSFGGEKGQDARTAQLQNAADFSVEQTQKELEEILSDIDGVGRVRVMLTVASGIQRVYQSDREISYSGLASTPEDYTSTTQTVLLDRSGSGDEALQTQELYPPYVGALVVCDGAGNSGTVLKVKEAVSVLTGLGSDCISVARRTES